MRIAVITPTHNRKTLLPDALDSVKKSVISPLSDISIHHIIYDDGSTDNTETLFEEQANVTYIKGKERKGQAYARNKAISSIDCDYIFNLDSDDVILQRTLYNFAKAARSNPETGWFVSDFIRTDKELRYLIGNDYYGWNFENISEFLQAVFDAKHFLQGNVFFKKTLFDMVGGYDENMNMAEDLDLYVRFALQGKMPLYCNFMSHLHRFHDNNISRNIGIDKYMKDLDIIKEKNRDRLNDFKFNV